MSAELENQVVDLVCHYTKDPLGYVRAAFPWGQPGDLQKFREPWAWQRKVLSHIGTRLSAPRTRFSPIRIAVASGHGIGKSALVSMIINWGMSTCEDCKIVLTANTEQQLTTKSWPEVQKWTRMAINAHWWNVGKTRITIKNKREEDTWRCDQITWSENNTEAFAGLHNQGKRIILIFDEASAIIDKIWETAEGAMTDKDTEIIWLAFGNPTQNVGRFSECFGNLKHRWATAQIDSRTVPGTNLEQFKQWAEDYGDDSDFFRIRVRGEFPRAASNQFIGNDVVAICRRWRAPVYGDDEPKVLSVDVARFGSDQTVLGIRQGRKIRVVRKARGLSTAQTTDLVMTAIDDEGPLAVVVDADGVGGTVIDQLKARGVGRLVHEFHGGHPAYDGKKYFNRRSEVWGLLREAMKNSIELPDDPELARDLVTVQYGFSGRNQVQLEKKDDIKKRGFNSPDMADMCAMSYAVRLAPGAVAKKPKPKYSYQIPGQQQQNWMQ